MKDPRNRARMIALEIQDRERKLGRLMTTMTTGASSLSQGERIRIRTLEMQQAMAAMDLADAVLAGSPRDQKKRHGKKWKREI